MKVLVVEYCLDGHHAFFLSLIQKTFFQRGDETIVLAPPLTQHLKDSLRLEGCSESAFQWETIQDASLISVIRQTHQLAQDLKVDLVFFAYLDKILNPLFQKLDDFPYFEGKLSGIHFSFLPLNPVFKWFPPIKMASTRRCKFHRYLKTPAVKKPFPFFVFYH